MRGVATAGTGDGAIAPRRRAGRRARVAVAAVAIVVLGALVVIDCLNLIGSETWDDLSRTPHLNAVHRPRELASAPARRAPAPPAALPAAPRTLAPLLVVAAVVVARATQSWLGPDLRRTRAPPRALVAGAPS
jgi:hypothetical protein